MYNQGGVITTCNTMNGNGIKSGITSTVQRNGTNHGRSSGEHSEFMVIVGTFVHATNDHQFQVLSDYVVGVRNSKIEFLAPKCELPNLTDTWGFCNSDVRYLAHGEFMIPGLVDTHIHAPQYVFTGTATDKPLLEWLNTYTFPVESKFKDLEFASHAYRDVVYRTLKNGTTTACYYATIDPQASLILAEMTASLGQRAFVGKVNMDTSSPNYYIETTQDSIRDTEWFIDRVKDLNCPRVSPIITPRFAISCTSSLMSQLGELAKKHDLRIQTHMDETINEIAGVKEAFPQYPNYARVYDAHGLLTNKTVLGHCIYMDDDEISLVKERGAGISHCPCSNFTIMSGVMNMRKRIQQGLKVSLGTDVSGGYSPSILTSMRQAMIASKVCAMQQLQQVQVKEKCYPVEYKEAFILATLGGSEVLGLSDKIGNFEVGKEFDALLINPYATDSPFSVYDSVYKDSLEDIIQKFIFLGDDRNISEVYVAGEKISM